MPLMNDSEKSQKQSDQKQMDVAISVKLPRYLRDKANQKSEKTGVSISFIVRKAIEDWVNEDNNNSESVSN